jgi:hypothetical protein
MRAPWFEKYALIEKFSYIMQILEQKKGGNAKPIIPQIDSASFPIDSKRIFVVKFKKVKLLAN